MSHDLSAKYWDDRYLNDDFGWDLGQVSPALKDYSDQLTDKNLAILIKDEWNKVNISSQEEALKLH